MMISLSTGATIILGYILIIHQATCFSPVSMSCRNQRLIPFTLYSSNSGDDYKEYKIDEAPLSQTFQKAVVLQRAGDRSGALDAYQHFLKVAQAHEVDPMLYAEVYTNMGAIYAMQGKGDGTDQNKELRAKARMKAKDAFSEAVKYRPSLGNAWVNLALLVLAEGKELGTRGEQSKIEELLQDARRCCVRALGMDNDDERSRALATKLVGDIDNMLKQVKR